MLIYLDTCCYNRPFDIQKLITVQLETRAKLYIQRQIVGGKYDLAWSYILEYECMRNPVVSRREAIMAWSRLAKLTAIASDEIEAIAESLDRLKPLDALHVASAISVNCDYFITVDKGILRQHTNQIKIINPIDFVTETEA